MALRAADLIEALGGHLIGDPQRCFGGLAALELAQAQHLSFLSNAKYQQQLAASKAGCVIVSPQMQQLAQQRGDCIVAANPYLYFARATQLWKKSLPPSQAPLRHPSAVIDPQAQLHPSVQVGAGCVIEAGVHIGAGTVLKSNVSVGENCSIGQRCLLHPGVVVGADGFGFAQDEAGAWVKIEQLGAVRIGDDVEIGANTCIDRGALQDTVIECGVKLDNLIQIGHNVFVGRHTAMAGCVGVAGSAHIGARCTIGGGAVVLGHLRLAEGVNISAASVVTHSLHQSGHYSGFFPLDDNAAWEKNAAALKQLAKLRARIRALEAQIETLGGNQSPQKLT